jgi:catechol 2,3-dioxygenase-like lactoylglutathione lyase family enzyme
MAQLAPPNPAGVTLGHIQLTVKDLEAQTCFWTERMGGAAVKKDMIRFPGIYIVPGAGRFDRSACRIDRQPFRAGL